MQLHLICVGRMKSGPETELVTRYLDRAKGMGPSLGLSPLRVTELAESRARRPDDRKAEEAAAVLADCKAGVLVLFDERGPSLSSEEAAARLGAWRDTGIATATFVIGGADGLAETLRSRADLVLSFGRMTLPHQIVRILAAEQLYRAMTILAGHPYHRA